MESIHTEPCITNWMGPYDPYRVYYNIPYKKVTAIFMPVLTSHMSCSKTFSVAKCLESTASSTTTTTIVIPCKRTKSWICKSVLCVCEFTVRGPNLLKSFSFEAHSSNRQPEGALEIQPRAAEHYDLCTQYADAKDRIRGVPVSETWGDSIWIKRNRGTFPHSQKMAPFKGLNAFKNRDILQGMQVASGGNKIQCLAESSCC